MSDSATTVHSIMQGLMCWVCMQTKDEDMVPLTINCWPSISGNESYVNIEYECQADFDLQNIVVAIPCHQPPKVNQVGTLHGRSSIAGMLLRLNLQSGSLHICMYMPFGAV